ncbi:MAG: sigma-70 family RNA polymerase sigma factor [Planctomycetes bacterium]|nr:sigma-70 family RNA polymerase sigma factor [Planctomycetota bacterium]
MPDGGDAAREFLRFRAHGDAGALARVFDATARELLLVAEHLAGDPHDAEDLVQTTFVHAMRDAAHYDARRPLLAWLCGILAHRAADLHRRRAHRPVADLDRAEGRHDPHPDVDPVALATGAELQDAVAKAIRSLPREQRAALALRLHHGLGSAEIARALGQPQGTVRSWLSRGLVRLRALLPRSLAAPALLAMPGAPSLARVREAVLAAMPHTAAVSASAAPLPLAVLAMQKTTLLSLVAIAFVVVTVWVAWPATRALHGGSETAASAVLRPTTAPRVEPSHESPAADSERRTEARLALAPPAPLPGPAEIRGRALRVDAASLPEPPTSADLRTVSDWRRASLEPARAAPWPRLSVGWLTPAGDRFVPVTRTAANGDFRVLDDRPEPPRALLIARLEDDVALGVERDWPSGCVVVRVPPPPNGGRWVTTDLGDLPLRPHLDDLTVEVRDPSGGGVEGVFVFLEAPPTGHPRLESWGGIDMRTGADGTARFHGLAPAGTWLVQLRDLPTGLVFAGGDKALTRLVRFAPDAPRFRTTLQLAADDHTIRGRVVDESGAPIEGVRIEGFLGNDQQGVATDAFGRFEFSGEPGAVLTQCAVPPRVPGVRRPANLGYEPWRAAGPIPMGTADLEIVLRERGRLHLEVVSADGAPVDRFGHRDVALRPEPGGHSSFAWAEIARAPAEHARGRVELSVLRGEHWLLVSPGDAARHAPAGYLRYTMPESGTLSLRVALPDASARTVTVVGTDGTAVAGSRVELIVHYGADLTSTAGDPLRGPIALDGALQASHFGRPRLAATATTDAAGRCALVWRADGGDRLSLRVRGAHPEAHLHDLAWHPGEPLVVTVPRGPMQRGRVVPDDVLDRLAETRDSGTGRIGSAAATGPAARPRLTLTLTSESLGPDGEPWRLGTATEPLRIGDDGRFEIPSLPAGRWLVAAELEGRPGARVLLTTWDVPADGPRAECVELDLSPLLPSRVVATLHHDLGGDARLLRVELRYGNWSEVVDPGGRELDLQGVPPGELRFAAVAELPGGIRLQLHDPEPLQVRPGAALLRHAVRLARDGPR